MDVLTKEQRRKNMQNIKAKDTKIEIILRKALWKKGYRYRKNYKKLPGSPDICLTKYRIAIFCDSEFFHGKDWEVLKAKWYTNDNIDQMLMERHLNKKARRSSHKNHIKGPKKCTEEDDERFAQSFEKMIRMAVESEM